MNVVGLFEGLKRKSTAPEEPVEAAQWRSLGIQLTQAIDLFVLRPQSDSGKRFLKKIGDLRERFGTDVVTTAQFGAAAGALESESSEFAIAQRQDVEALIHELGAAVSETLDKFAISIEAAGKPLDGIEEVRKGLTEAQSAKDLDQVRTLLARSVAGLQKVAEEQSARERALRIEFQAHAKKLSAHLAQAHEESRQDCLTALANRRGFEDHMETAMAKARVDQTRRSLALLDLDGFKKLNDTFGHAAGDAALVTFANRLRKATGDKAFIARFGGDEFAVEADVTPTMLEGMFVKLANICGEHPCFHEDRRMTIRFSYGITDYDGSEPAADIRKRADTALYAYKANRGAPKAA